jgi:hypothetical protein
MSIRTELEKQAKEDKKEISHTLKRTLQGAGIGAGTIALLSLPGVRNIIKKTSTRSGGFVGKRMKQLRGAALKQHGKMTGVTALGAAGAGAVPGALVGIGESTEKKASVFWDGFEKRARGGISGIGPAGILHPLNILNAMGSTTDTAKGDNREAAEAMAKLVASDKKIRKKDMLQYLLNPAAPGPLTEIMDRLQRRHLASTAEHPVRSNLIPLYGAIRGGKAGKPKD